MSFDVFQLSLIFSAASDYARGAHVRIADFILYGGNCYSMALQGDTLVLVTIYGHSTASPTTVETRIDLPKLITNPTLYLSSLEADKPLSKAAT